MACKFSNENFILIDQTGHLVELDDELLVTLLEENSEISVEELAMKLHSKHTTVHRHLQQLGKVPKLGKWVSHELSQVNHVSRVDICLSLYSRERSTPFLDRLVTGDEKFISYQIVQRRKQWLGHGKKAQPQPKKELHANKVLLSICWDSKGINHFDLLPPNTITYAQIYCQRLVRLNMALKKKCFSDSKRSVVSSGQCLTQHCTNHIPKD
ncbi:histone-lysine N-methyltransferase SETMAR-like [Oratosquilla oratoria]|uniref:histone-lysine N-methyltransferase SETMAR-like n=1 Tax=Oratosquilla oratoria TaxID=337810 RepID=UPI003F77531A